MPRELPDLVYELYQCWVAHGWEDCEISTCLIEAPDYWDKHEDFDKW